MPTSLLRSVFLRHRKRRYVPGAPVLIPLWLIAAISTARAAPCEFEPAPPPTFALSKPFPPVEPSAVVRVRGAEKDAPLSIMFDASGPVWFHWTRFSTGGKPDLRQRVEIEKQPAGSSDFKPYCDADWTPLAQLPGFRRLKLDNDVPTKWRIKVFQENLTPSVSVLDEDLSEIMLIGSFDPKVKVDPAPLPFFDVWRLARGQPTPACDSSIAAAPSDAEPAQAAQLPGDALNVPGSIHTLSGRNLFLSVGRLEAGAPVSLSFEAKPIGYAWPAAPICIVRLTTGVQAAGQWIKATAPWEFIDNIRWTVILSGKRPSPAMDVWLYRDRQPSRQIAVDTRGTDVYSCTKKDRGREQVASSDFAAVFQGAYALTVRTGLREIGVTGDSYRHVVDAVLIALGNWRAACTKCTPYQFSVIDLDGDVYVPEDMLTGAAENHRATFARGYPWDVRPYVRKNTGLFTTALQFVKVSGTLRQRRRFCNQDPEPGSRFSPAASPLCRPSVVSNEDEMIVNLEWRSATLSCDQRPGVVACWNGTDLIEMNLREFSFYSGNVGQVLVGSSHQQVDLIRVFTHEVGHWLGLGHLQPDGNIMAAHYAEARCIDDAALTKVNAIASGLERPSHEPESLLYDK